MSRKPLVSVVMPVYNAQATLKKCADSVLAQNWESLELVLVDDGSTDSSPAMVDACVAEHPDRVRAVHKENGGLMSAWLAGVRESTGDYLCFVDSDDWIDAEMIAEMAAALTDDAGPGQIICCGYVIEYGDGSGRNIFHGLPDGVYEGERLENELKRELLGHEKRRVIFSRCMKLVSRELIENNTEFLDPSIRLGEDVNIMLPALLDASRVVLIAKPYYHYLLVQDSMAHRYDAGFYEDCKKLRDRMLAVVRAKGRPAETMVQREFLFLFLQTVKIEVRGDGKPGATGRAVRRIRQLCGEQNSRELLALYPERISDPANRLIAFVCKKPTVFRILAVRLVFCSYELFRRVRQGSSNDK